MSICKSLIHITLVGFVLSYAFAAALATGGEERKEDHYRGVPLYSVPIDYKSWKDPRQFEEYLEKSLKDKSLYNFTEVPDVLRHYFRALRDTYLGYDPICHINKVLRYDEMFINKFIDGAEDPGLCVKLASHIDDESYQRLSEILDNIRFEAGKARKPTPIEILYQWLTGTGYAAVGATPADGKKSA